MQKIKGNANFCLDALKALIVQKWITSHALVEHLAEEQTRLDQLCNIMQLSIYIAPFRYLLKACPKC